MIKFDDVTKENIKEHNPNWSQAPDHPYKILIIGGSGSGKTNALLNYEPDIDKIYLYAKEPHKAKYQLLIDTRKSTGLRHFDDSKAFIEYSNDMDDTYKSIEEYNPNKKRKILIVFGDMIADMLSNRKLNPIVTELFIRGRNANICLVFITQSNFVVPKNIRLNSTHYFIMKIANKQELQQTAFNHSSDIDLKDFTDLYKKCTAKPYSFLVINATRENIKINMTDDKIGGEKLQYDINREAAKISAFIIRYN